MARVDRIRFGRLVRIEYLDDTEVTFQEDYVDTEGLIVICESEHKQPGREFIRYFPYEEGMIQRYLTIPMGDIDETDSGLTLKTQNTVYSFIKCSSLSEDEKIELILNVFGRV